MTTGSISSVNTFVARKRPVCVEKTLYASKAAPRMQKGSAVSGGSPISLNVATRETKGFLMCVQSYVLKHLLFKSQVSQPTEPDKLLQPSEDIQDVVLCQVLTEILWKMTDREMKKCAVVCLPQQNVYINGSSNFSKDGVTETLHLFELANEEELHSFFEKYLHIFQGENGPGSLLFLYSILLTKGFDRIRDELNKEYEQLLTPRGEGTQALVNLLLTGRATPFLHNGVVYESDLHTADRFAKIGIMDRSEIGYLMWQMMDSSGTNQVGSRLKTPRMPIWLTRTDGQYGVLFHNNRDLTRDYRAEYRFDLQYYSSSRCQTEIVLLTIDTRISRPAEEREIPALELLIMTKWQGAKVFWNGVTPFV